MKILKRKFLINIFILLIINFPFLASAKIEIVAKIGSEIITSFELENKIRRSLFLTGQELNQKNINEVKSLSLNFLVNYKLKKEELKKYKVKKNNEIRVNDHLKNVALNLNVNISELKNLFLSNQLDYKQYLDEINTEFLWQEYIYRMYSKNIDLNEDQIITELNATIQNQQSIIEYHLAEIEIKSLENIDFKAIKDYINQFGFNKAATKYSISNSAVNGGNIGWVSSKVLSNEVESVLKNLNVGNISNPIQRAESIVVLKLIDKKTISNADKTKIEQLKNSIIKKQTSDMLSMYSNNHLSKKRNSTLIEIK
jgi:peptidyl-prolyl cis-trans isomerase SurA|tara:strand:- start:2201 stop:3136 length:936 start_codon:yes stop_codon:yes gene_type:complete